MSSWLKRVDIVLCRPEGAWNVGASCRAMKTMGLESLILVQPSQFDLNEVYRMAIHARDIYNKAKKSLSLPEALSGSILSAGITRRRGARRKWFSLLPEELAERAASSSSGRIAVVFGNERAGLSDEELNHCNIACHIPSNDSFPSLNLSHAVQIISTAFWRHAIGGKTGSYQPIPREELDSLVEIIHNSLDAMGYFKAADRFHTDRYFRDILARSAMSTREAEHMEKIFRKLQYLRNPSENTEAGEG